MSTYFISDLHLSLKRPKTSEVFLRFLDEEASKGKALYILGDFFEYWLGDDVPDPHQLLIMDALARLAEKNIPVYFMHGNRDFLIGKAFAKHSKCILLKDPAVIQLYNRKIVLTHGDKLCTLDKNYQRFRRVIRNPLMQIFLANLPVWVRKKIAQKLRAKSPRHVIPTVRPRHWDVVFEDVCKLLEHHHSDMLIHGHTHQPKILDFTWKDKFYRHVILGEWEETGSFLKFSPNGIELKTFS